MRRTASPSTRPLSQHENKIFQSTELRGRLSKRALQLCNTIEKWENVMAKGAATINKEPPRVERSPQRCREYNQAKRTLYPEFNNEQEKAQSKKILASPEKSKNSGTWGSLMSKTQSVQEFSQSGIRVFKDRSPGSPFEKVSEARFQKAYSPVNNNWCSHISSLPCTTYREEKQPMLSSAASTRRKFFGDPTPSTNSSFFVEPCFLGSEEQRRQIAEKKQLARHLNSTMDCVPLQAPLIPNKRYHNKESDQPSLDEGRLNSSTKGKRFFSPDITQARSMSEVEPFNPLSRGKKKISPPSPNLNNNTSDRSAEEFVGVGGRGRSLFSYRTFASQVPL